MDNELHDAADRLRLYTEALMAQAAAQDLSAFELAQWRANGQYMAIWAMAAEQESAYRALLSEHVVAQTAALTRIADALERVLALPTGDGMSRPAEAFTGLREQFGQYFDEVETPLE